MVNIRFGLKIDKKKKKKKKKIKYKNSCPDSVIGVRTWLWQRVACANPCAHVLEEVGQKVVFVAL